VQPKLLVVAALGLVLSWIGFWSIGYIFSGTLDPDLSAQIEELGQPPIHWIRLAERLPAKTNVPLVNDTQTIDQIQPTRKDDDADTQFEEVLSPAAAQQVFYESTLADVPVYWPWERLSRPFRKLFSPNLSVSSFAFNFLCAVWAALVWTFCGGVICRTASMQLAAEEKISLSRALLHVRKKWLAYFLAPIGTLLAFLVIVLFVGLVGLLLRAEIGLLLGAIVWPVVLGLGVLGTLILAGLFFGWPLMWAVVGVEHSDHYDALSRSFTYVLSRPLHFLFYLAIATAIGSLGWIAAAAFAEFVIYLSAWSACRFAHPELFPQIMATVPHPWPLSTPPIAEFKDVDGAAWAGLQIIRFWASIVCLLVAGFVYSYFWTAACGCYLLLRYHVDGNELDDIALDDDEEPHELPPLAADEKGVPVVADESTADMPTE
jgi:hypothetical protein